MAKILVIDDERAIRNTLKEILEFEGYTVEVAENGRIGLERALSNAFDLIFTDIKMPEMDGMEFLQAYREGMAQQNSEEVPVVVITGHGSVDTAVESLKGGAFDFIQKPLDLNRLLVTTKHAIDHKSLVQETKVLRKKVGKRNQMIGESAAIARVRAIIDKVAPTEAREGEILEIEEKLKHAVIIKDGSQKKGIVSLGSTVEIIDEEDGVLLTYEIVGTTEADVETGRISN